MEHALAVVGADEVTKDLVREAGELAAGVDAELTLLCVTNERDYDEKREALQSIPEANVTYSLDQARDGARAFAEDIGREVLGDTDIAYEAVGTLGDRTERILDEADRRGCDHVFLTGERRSPTGKAIFGDTTQQVVLEFDGPVTVHTA